jgi:mannosyltransferase OCH1-like enzyme
MSIPRRLHFVWVGPPMPEHLQANVECWERLHPDWEVKVWGEEDLRWMKLRPYFDIAEKLVPKDAVGQFRADLARYEILYRWGGFYADVDTYPLKPIDAALRGKREFAAAEDVNYVGNTYLGAVPRHEVFEDVIKSLPNSIGVNQGKRPCISTGPQFLTPIWRQYKCYTAPTHDWFPVSYKEVRAGEKPEIKGDPYAMHEWFHSQQLREAKHGRG